MISIGTVKANQAAFMTPLALAAAIVFASTPSQAGDSYKGAMYKKERVAAHTESAKSHKPSKGTHWGYTGNAGPEHWGKLSSKYKACSVGQTQSPINLKPSEGATVEPILFDYHATPLSIMHSGHTVQVSYQPGSTISIGDKRYELLQFHFHTPSEHRLNGNRSEMEVHFVHRSKDGDIAVIGILMNAGTYNASLAEIWKRMPARESAEQIHRNVLINAADLLPKRKKYFRYMGSLTTPPCSEGVHWYVLDTPITVGASQVKRLANAVGDNARPIQALNNRLLLAPRN